MGSYQFVLVLGSVYAPVNVLHAACAIPSRSLLLRCAHSRIARVARPFAYTPPPRQCSGSSRHAALLLRSMCSVPHFNILVLYSPLVWLTALPRLPRGASTHTRYRPVIAVARFTASYFTSFHAQLIATTCLSASPVFHSRAFVGYTFILPLRLAFTRHMRRCGTTDDVGLTFNPALLYLAVILIPDLPRFCLRLMTHAALSLFA